MPTPAKKAQFPYLQPGSRAGDGSFVQYLKPRESNDGLGKYLNKSDDRHRTRFRTL